MGEPLLDRMDADSTWVPVFMDDAAALFVRRDGPLAPVAERFGYRVLPAGVKKLVAVAAEFRGDPVLRARAVAEFEREAAGSAYHSLALVRLGATWLAAGDTSRARAYFARALAGNPSAPRAHEWLARIALADGHPETSLRELRAERRNTGNWPGYDLAAGRAYQALGEFARARASYRRALASDPGDPSAADSLEAMETRLGR